jgi:DHA1 family tetracycline resistance protein-like MFS transporter
LSAAQSKPPTLWTRKLLCCYGALCSLVCVKAVVAQALPLMLMELSAQPDRVAQTLSTVCAGSAAFEFLLLPAVAALSDTHGRRPLLLVIPLLIIALRMLVVANPCLRTLVISRVVVGALVNYFDLFVGVTAADLFSDDDEALASLEGKTAAAWGGAYGGGMLVGGWLLSRTAGGAWSGAIGAYRVSAGLAVVAFAFALGAGESLSKAARVPFSLRGTNPLTFTRLFRSGRTLGVLATILVLQTLHDGEGDVWQIYGADVHGWGTRGLSLYGAAVGIASTIGGLLTGRSVRWLGNRRHTLLWTFSTALSCLLFMVPSPYSSLAIASVVFTAAEDCMSASVIARLIQVGAAAGLTKGSLAGAVHNLSAFVRIVALYIFGRLYVGGQRVGMPSLPYSLCTATQFAACALALALPAAQWSSSSSSSSSTSSSTSSSAAAREPEEQVQAKARVEAFGEAGSTGRGDDSPADDGSFE